MAVRAARAWSGKSRAELGRDIGVAAGTIGRWERGDWKADPPTPPMLAAIARVTDAEALTNQVLGLLSDDPATRFAAVARAEAQRPDVRRRSSGSSLNGVDAAGEAP